VSLEDISTYRNSLQVDTSQTNSAMMGKLLSSHHPIHCLQLRRSKMFNTGDIVSWREDGCLDTFGRMDDQVKIKVRHSVLYQSRRANGCRASELN
jgi:non-ribosomal peptide synthetase component F